MHEELLRSRPVAMCIGAQKAGTTSLHALLASHPHVGLPFPKETKFFVRKARYRRGLGYYSARFPRSDPRVVVEVDADYMFFPDVARRLHAFRPDMRIVALLRNPVERAYSHYRMTVSRGIERRPFAHAVFAPPRRSTYRQLAHFSYLARGFYWTLLEPYLRLFGPQQLLLLRFEDLRSEPASSIRALEEWLGLDDGSLPRAWPHENKGLEIRRAATARLLSTDNPVRLTAKRLLGDDGRVANVARAARQRNIAEPDQCAPPPLPTADPRLLERLQACYRPDLLRLHFEMGIRVDDWIGAG